MEGDGRQTASTPAAAGVGVVFQPDGPYAPLPSCQCLMMKLESIKVSDRSVLLLGSSFGLSDISEGSART